jgi:ubiquitin conjugation factor E4 B
MKFYIEAESTGTHTQFYDKFNIRYEIFQVIKKIWPNTLYRESLAKEAQVNTDFFVQFVNMIVNDVTFVLDESLTAFTKIHDLTVEMKSPAFAALNEEQRKEKEELLEDQKSKAKSYMGLMNESMETLIMFTETLPDAFTMPEIVQRLADMLDYNLNIMVDERQRKNLIVENPQEYKWNPRELLLNFVKVFLNLSGKENFVSAIAKDGRSYRPENFDEAARLLTNKISFSVTPEELSAWIALGERVAATKAAEEEEEADLGEIPDEYLDPLLADLMMDPVILPTSKITVDRATIRSHLLSEPRDPFNRSPLKIEEVVPNTELKKEIEEWKAKRLAEKRTEKAAAAGGQTGEAMDTSA